MTSDPKLPIGEGVRDLLHDFTSGQKLLIVGVVFAVVAIACAGGYAWSGWKIKGLEKDAAEAITRANRMEDIAAAKEIEAAQYKAKIEHLEKGLVEIKEIAKTQDEELKKLDSDVLGARGAVDRARRVRAVATTRDELCKRLAEVEHPCYE